MLVRTNLLAGNEDDAVACIQIEDMLSSVRRPADRTFGVIATVISCRCGNNSSIRNASRSRPAVVVGGSTGVREGPRPKSVVWLPLVPKRNFC